MDKFSAFIADKPECFGYRRTLLRDAPCTTCKYTSTCLASVWRVFNAVKNGELPAAGYLTGELKHFREQHHNVCKSYGMSDLECMRTARQFPLEILERLHPRVLPPRTPEDVESARVLDDLLAEAEAMSDDETESRQVTESVADATQVGSNESIPTEARPTSPPPTTTPLPRATSSALEYNFPMPADRPYKHLSNAELQSHLRSLVDAAFHSTPTLGYSKVRQEFCALHVEMNLRQQHAPRFRPTHKLKRELSAKDDVTESRDRQVIDLHWRAHSSNKPICAPNNYPTLLNDAPFDCAAAERFAQEEWSPAAKAIHLHLVEEMEWEHAILQSDQVRKKWVVIERGDIRAGGVVRQLGAPQIEQRLRDAVRRAKKVQVLTSVPGMVDAWKARAIAGEHVAEIARLIALMSGSKPRDRQAVRRTLRSLDRYLGKSA